MRADETVKVLNMKVLSRFRVFALFVCGLGVAATQADAQQQSLSFSVTSPTNTIAVNSTFTYTISVTNNLGALLQNVLVTNLLPASLQFVTATNQFGYIFPNPPSVAFTIFNLPGIGAYAQMTLTVRPTAAGFVTNQVSLFSGQLGTTNLMVVNEITNPTPTMADLAVALTGPSQPVIRDDLFPYTITVTNLGPTEAFTVTLTNSLPAGVELLSVSPSGQTYTRAGTNLVFDLGAMTNYEARTLRLRLHPTNSGLADFSASVSGSGPVTDSNSTNNTAELSVSVGDYLSTNLTVSLVSTQQLDPQVTLLEQWIRVSNKGASDVPSARVLISGLTNLLYNGVGTNVAGSITIATNEGTPFVTYGDTLPAGRSVDLLLQFAPNRSPFPLDGSQLQAYGVPAANLSPTLPPGTAVHITGIVQLSSGSVLITVLAQTNRTYSVWYSDDASFSNARVAQPSPLAQANWLQWIDYGPPETISHPTNSAARFYRVFLNP